MKSIVVVLVVMLAQFGAWAQIDLESGRYTYHRAVRQQASKKEIFNKSLLWAQENFKGAKGIVKYQSAENGKLVIEVQSEHVVNAITNVIYYTMVIEARNGVYRESFKDFKYKGKGGRISNFESKKLAGKKKILYDTSIQVEGLSESLIEMLATDILVTR